MRPLLTPTAWSVIGTFAAFQHGIAQDHELLVAELAGTVLVRRVPAHQGLANRVIKKIGAEAGLASYRIRLDTRRS